MFTAALPNDCYTDARHGLEGMARSSKKNFCDNLKRIMQAMDVDGSELARRIKRTPTTVSRWRKGIQEPSFKDMDAIASALGVPVQDLFLDPDDEKTTGIPLDKALMMVTEAVREKLSEHQDD
jgi:transcriptional regulator with XRE-family HTH domain